MNRYPTDEELNRFIEELEQQKLYAPGHLKDEILMKAAKQKRKGEKESEPASFLMYTLKMAVGMAAAVFLVFAIPSDGIMNLPRDGIDLNGWETSKEPEVWGEDKISLDEKIISHMDQKREETDRLFDKISNLFQRNDLGGIHHEN